MGHNRSLSRQPSVRKAKHPSLCKRINRTAAGIDCVSEAHYVAVPTERDPEPVRSFRTFTGDLRHLADWLGACKIKTVAMESTGVYWIPIFEILEERGFEVVGDLDECRDIRQQLDRSLRIERTPEQIVSDRRRTRRDQHASRAHACARTQEEVDVFRRGFDPGDLLVDPGRTLIDRDLPARGTELS